MQLPLGFEYSFTRFPISSYRNTWLWIDPRMLSDAWQWGVPDKLLTSQEPAGLTNSTRFLHQELSRHEHTISFSLPIHDAAFYKAINTDQTRCEIYVVPRTHISQRVPCALHKADGRSGHPPLSRHLPTIWQEPTDYWTTLPREHRLKPLWTTFPTIRKYLAFNLRKPSMD